MQSQGYHNNYHNNHTWRFAHVCCRRFAALASLTARCNFAISASVACLNHIRNRIHVTFTLVVFFCPSVKFESLSLQLSVTDIFDFCLNVEEPVTHFHHLSCQFQKIANFSNRKSSRISDVDLDGDLLLDLFELLFSRTRLQAGWEKGQVNFLPTFSVRFSVSRRRIKVKWV